MLAASLTGLATFAAPSSAADTQGAAPVNPPPSSVTAPAAAAEPRPRHDTPPALMPASSRHDMAGNTGQTRATDTTTASFPARPRHAPDSTTSHERAAKHAPQAAPAGKTGKTPPAAHKLTLQEKLVQAEQALSHKENDQQAQALMKKAEALRLYSVKSSGRLLLETARDALKKGHADKAEGTLSAAITLQPDNAFLRRQRAAIRFLGNDLTGAVEDLQIALVHDSGDAQSWDLLAHTQEHLHHPKQALHAYTEALTHAPLLPGGQERYRKLEQQAHGIPD